MKFQVCFTLAKHEHNMLSLCETANVFIDAFFCYSKIHFYHLGSFKLIKTMLKSLNVCKVYRQCGMVIQRVVTKHELPIFIIIIGFLINVQVQGHHPHQWAPFQVTG